MELKGVFKYMLMINEKKLKYSEESVTVLKQNSVDNSITYVERYNRH